MENNRIVQLKSYDENTGNETANVFPVTNHEAVKVGNDKNLKEQLVEINENLKQTNALLDAGIKFAVVGDHSTVPPINNNGSREIELQSSHGYIQWRYKGGQWNNLIAITELQVSGPQGVPGKDGITPNVQIGTVTTLEPGRQATVINRGTNERPIFDFGIPKGESGRDGVQGSFDSTTIFSTLKTKNKTVIGAINELFDLIKNNGTSDNTDNNNSNITPGTTGIKVEPANLEIKVNQTTDVTITLGSDVVNNRIEYMSSNGSIANVSDLGNYRYRITGVGQGHTSIMFRTFDGKFVTSCNVTVTQSSTSNRPSPEVSNEYTRSCTSEYILDKMYPMGQAHEAIPSGIITDTWKYNSRWENQYRPTAVAHSCGQSGCPGAGQFKALGCWSNIYRVEGTPFSTNTGVEMKDIKVYGWYNGQWELVQHLPVPNGNFYPESFGGDVNKYFADSVKQTSTSKTIMLRERNKINAMNWNTGQLQTENCMYHPFSNIKNFDTKYEYIYTCIDLRKVLWDANGVDDRNQAHYCSNCGGDWWLAEGLMFHNSWQHNKGVCQPKMIEITNEWRRFSMTTVPQSWQHGFPK